MSKIQLDFLRHYNDAFIAPDLDFIIDNVTDDVRWEMAGESVLEGKEAFIQSMGQMRGMDILEMNVDDIFVSEGKGAVTGTMRTRDPSGEEYHFAFCDLYELRGESDPKVSKLKAFVLPIKEG